MQPTDPLILILNAGSSSIKFALYPAVQPLLRVLEGKLDRIGSAAAKLSFRATSGTQQSIDTVAVSDTKSAATALLDWLEGRPEMSSIRAVGHRIVHGMDHHLPESVSSALVEELHRISPCDPEHLPRQIELIESLRQRRPDWPQVVCFDTAFHQGMPRVAKLLPLPRRLEAKGMKRYGFHGLSYQSLMEQLIRIHDPAAKNGRVLLAHLGNGASMSAVRDGVCVDTSMGFTPTAGLVMGTRSGDLDPGIASFLSRTEGMSTEQFHKMVTCDSGLLGISETSSDMRDLLQREATDVRAAEAIAIFCQQAKKWIGSFAAVLGGLDTVVFTGGIGENCPAVRHRICQGLEFLRIELDSANNQGNVGLISNPEAHVKVWVLTTDEEGVVAAAVHQRLFREVHASATRCSD